MNNHFAGIDLGLLNNCGYAIVDQAGDIVVSGVWDLGKKSLIERLDILYWNVRDLFNSHTRHLRAIGIEDPWIQMNKYGHAGKLVKKGNVQVGLKLAKAWGVVFAAGSLFGLLSWPFSPTQIKKAMTGYGRADKDTMLLYARSMSANTIIDSFDEADAIAAALAAREEWIEKDLIRQAEEENCGKE